MSGKGKKNENGGIEGDHDTKNSNKKMKKDKSEILRSSIKNKEKRSAVHAKLKLQKKLDKTRRRDRLGHRIGRLIQSLFPQDPNFRGRRVVTFHNQRDFIFFRHHSKQSDSKGKKAKEAKGESITKEKVVARLQHGTFDTKGGEYEWVHKPEMDTSRRRFFL